VLDRFVEGAAGLSRHDARLCHDDAAIEDGAEKLVATGETVLPGEA